MSTSSQPTTGFGHSARVALWLEAGGQRIPLSHSSSTYIIAAEPVSLPPCQGHIIVHIDESRFERTVYLSHGMNPTIRDTPIEPVTDVNAA